MMPPGTRPLTLFDKIWARHVVTTRADGASLLYVDRHLVQDGSAQAFDILRVRGLKARAPALAVASADHYVPSSSRVLADQLVLRLLQPEHVVDVAREVPEHRQLGRARVAEHGAHPMPAQQLEGGLTDGRHAGPPSHRA